jgi:tripartite-type tricarboxylate transporter receptor subunit TctC
MSYRLNAQRILAAFAFGAAATLANAQAFPTKPVRIVVPWPAGGLVDIAARQLATRLQAALGQPVVVDNKAGAGGNIGADQVAKAAADGYTLLFTTSALTINTALQPKLPFNFGKDFEPLALVATAPSVLVVGPSITPASVKELIDAAKAKPGKLSYASAGIGSPAHLTGELFKTTNQLFVVHVPYAGAPAALNDQIAGRIDYQFANMTVALPQIRAGKVKALAVTSKARFPGLPQVPTMVEAGVAGFEADQWLGLLGPRGLPKAVSERLTAEVNKALANDELRNALLQAGMTPAAAGTPAAFDAMLKQDLAKWSAVVKAQNIQPE